MGLDWFWKSLLKSNKKSKFISLYLLFGYFIIGFLVWFLWFALDWISYKHIFLIFCHLCFWETGQIYNRISRVEHVDHARRSAQHCVKALLSAQTHTYIGLYVPSIYLWSSFFFFCPCWFSWIYLMIFRYDYLPYFYSRIFEYEGSPRKVWWQFFGDNGKY